MFILSIMLYDDNSKHVAPSLECNVIQKVICKTEIGLKCKPLVGNDEMIKVTWNKICVFAEWSQYMYGIIPEELVIREIEAIQIQIHVWRCPR